MIAFESGVGIPFSSRSVSVHDLDKPDPAFHQSSGTEELPGK